MNTSSLLPSVFTPCSIVADELFRLTSMPRHSLNRRLPHSLTRRCGRRTARRVGRGSRVNFLAQALAAFNRAVRARCQLARLALEIFDSVVVSRRDEEREARRQLMAEWESAFEKVFGPAADSSPEKLHHAETGEWCRNGAVFPMQDSEDRVPHCRAGVVDGCWRGGTGATSSSSAHRRVSLGMAVRLVDLASKLGRFAVGLDLCPRQGNQHPPSARTFRSLPACLSR